MTPDMMASISDNLLPSVGSILPKVDSLLSSLNTLVSDPALLKSVQRLDGITNDLSQATNGLSAVMKRDVPRLMGSTVALLQILILSQEILANCRYSSSNFQ